MYGSRGKMLLHIVVWLSVLAATEATTTTTTNTTDPHSISNISNYSKPGCESQCGKLKIPYPFGIGTGCAVEHWFELTCNASFNPPRLFLGGLRILDISDTQFRISNNLGIRCYNPSGEVTKDYYAWANITMTPFSLSDANTFTVVGCDDLAAIGLRNGPHDRNFSSACVSVCASAQDVTNGTCSGSGCCQTSVPRGSKYYFTEMSSFNNHTMVHSFQYNCGYAFLGDSDSFVFNGVSDLQDPEFEAKIVERVPIVLDWAIGNGTCEQAHESIG